MLKNCLQHQACDYLITLIFIRLLWLSIVQIFPIESQVNLLVFSSYFELHSLVLFNPPYFSRKNFFISMVLNQLQVFYKSKIQQKTIDLEL